MSPKLNTYYRVPMHQPKFYIRPNSKFKMGIRNMHRFLQNKCFRSIKPVTFSQLSGKTVAIDTSIFMYRFAGQDLLLENTHLFISLLQRNGITPIFIFDRKPAADKTDVLRQRSAAKRAALEKYNALKDIPGTRSTDLSYLRQQCVYLRRTDVLQVKALMNAHGVTYYNAVSEADPLCAYLVRVGRADACMSDDMDMFAYGCPRVIRNVNLATESAVLFDLDSMLADMGICLEEFRQIALLYGNDRCMKIDLPWQSLESVWATFMEWRTSTGTTDCHVMVPVSPTSSSTSPALSFYAWLLGTGKIDLVAHDQLCGIYASFATETSAFQADLQMEMIVKYRERCAPLLCTSVTVAQKIHTIEENDDNDKKTTNEYNEEPDPEPEYLVIHPTPSVNQNKPIDRKLVRQMMETVGFVYC